MRDGRVKLRNMMGPNSREQCGEGSKTFFPLLPSGRP